ncbi:MAG: HAMP domain-containing sensor histidine kinase [Polyangiaceae bacterium]
MSSSYELLRSRERLLVGRRFLVLRPAIALVGAGANAILGGASSAPVHQKRALAIALGSTVVAFFAEAWALRRRALDETWLFTSLALTLVALAVGSCLAGGLASPLLPLLFAPIVVGFAAFGRSRASAALMTTGALSLLLLAALGPLAAFPPLPAPWVSRMTLASALTSLALLGVGVIGLVDAHARVSAQLEGMRADVLEEAERRARSVDRLGAQVAHEVKNPLAAARSLVQLVARKAEARDRDRLDVVLAEIDRALDTLQGYLGLAKPMTDLTMADADLRDILEETAAVLEARAAQRRVRVRVEGPSLRAAVDRSRLRDAVLNLALNAIRAMPDGGELGLEVAPGPTLSVVDDGEGMSEAMLARAGEPFASESEGGTGLGIAIARGVVAQHGGALRFESAKGQGTRAIIELRAGGADREGSGRRST